MASEYANELREVCQFGYDEMPGLREIMDDEPAEGYLLIRCMHGQKRLVRRNVRLRSGVHCSTICRKAGLAARKPV